LSLGGNIMITNMAARTFSIPRALTMLATLPLILASTPQLLTASRDNSPSCDCYLISGDEPGYFQYHRFWDFRSIPSTYSPASIPNLVTSPDTDMDPTDASDLTSSYFTSEDWVRDWSIQNFSDADVATEGVYRQVASPKNIWVGSDCGNDGIEGGGGNTCLVLRSSRQKEGFQSVVEVDSNQMNLWRSSIRVRLRVVPTSEFGSDGGGEDDKNTNTMASGNAVSSGAVVGFFTYRSDTSESDIEILTRDPENQIRYSNQPDYDASTGESVPGASTESKLPESKNWTEWLTHRIDWLEDISQWWVDGVFALNKTVNVPGRPGALILSLWGDGGEWSGPMPVGSEVRVQVEWVQMAFNISGDIQGQSGSKVKRKRKKCEVACYVDAEGGPIGYPVLAFNSTSSGAVGGREGAWGGCWCGLLLGQVGAVSALLWSFS
jgi:Glycosyl hydrolases family 16